MKGGKPAKARAHTPTKGRAQQRKRPMHQGPGKSAANTTRLRATKNVRAAQSPNRELAAHPRRAPKGKPQSGALGSFCCHGAGTLNPSPGRPAAPAHPRRTASKTTRYPHTRLAAHKNRLHTRSYSTADGTAGHNTHPQATLTRQGTGWDEHERTAVQGCTTRAAKSAGTRATRTKGLNWRPGAKHPDHTTMRAGGACSSTQKLTLLLHATPAHAAASEKLLPCRTALPSCQAAKLSPWLPSQSRQEPMQGP